MSVCVNEIETQKVVHLFFRNSRSVIKVLKVKDCQDNVGQ